MTEPQQTVQERSAKQRELVKRSFELFPGGTVNMIVQPSGLEMILERGDGSYVFDVDGRRFLDCSLGGGSQIFGHAHPRIVSAVSEAMARGSNLFTVNRRAVELAERLVKYIPSAEMVRFNQSGSEATFGALRLARALTKRQGIIKFDGAYHGSHDLAVWSFGRTLYATGDAKASAGIPLPRPTAECAGTQAGIEDEVFVLPYNDSDAVRAIFREHPSRFAAVICEPYQRNLSPQPGFLETLREECDRSGTVLIFDEVVSGFRLAPGGAQEKYGVLPDLTTLGKAMSGGMPMAALVGRRFVMERLDPRLPTDSYSFLCGTHNGNLVAVEAAHVGLDMLIEERGLARLEQLGELARLQLKEAFVEFGVEAQLCGEGPMFHPYFLNRPVRSQEDVRAADWRFNDEFHRKLRQAGIHKSFGKGYLSLVHTEEQIDELVEASRWALQQLVGPPRAATASRPLVAGPVMAGTKPGGA